MRDQARDMEVAIKTELPGTVHTYSVAPMIRSAAAVALSPQRGCSSSTYLYGWSGFKLCWLFAEGQLDSMLFHHIIANTLHSKLLCLLWTHGIVEHSYGDFQLQNYLWIGESTSWKRNNLQTSCSNWFAQVIIYQLDSNMQSLPSKTAGSKKPSSSL